MKNKQVLLFLILILSAALFLRIYKLDSIPSSLMWDEVAVGYNAFTIANYGRDEWNNFFPLSFKSFEEYKMPVHIYITSIFVKIGGLNEITTRLPSAIFGVLGVLVLFLLVKELLKSNIAALFAAFLLAVSPYSIHFSRMAHEANFAIFFFLTAVLLFLVSIKRKSKLLILSAICFGLSIISYNAAKIVVPPLILALSFFYAKDLVKNKKRAILFVLVLSIFALLVIYYPGLSGKNRAEQTGFNSNFEIIKSRYLAHFDGNYLFSSGDKNPRLGVQVIGQSNYPEIILLVVGILSVFIKRSRIGFFLLTWFLIAPIPSTLFGGDSEIPHSARASFSLGVWQLLAASGYLFLINVLSKANFLRKIRIDLISFILVGVYLVIFTNQWFQSYLKDYSRYAIEWQYGMKQVVEYVRDHPSYSQIHMTDVRSQPYIFFLYYLKTPLPDFVKTAYYNRSDHRSSNLVTFFDKYYFGDWDSVESMPTPQVLYILSPSQYDGLRHKSEFQIKKTVKYPNGTDAFFIVSVY